MSWVSLSLWEKTLVLLGKRWQLPVSSRIILLLIPTEANSQRSEGWGFECRSGHRSTGHRTTHLLCGTPTNSAAARVFLLLWFRPGGERGVER